MGWFKGQTFISYHSAGSESKIKAPAGSVPVWETFSLSHRFLYGHWSHHEDSILTTWPPSQGPTSKYHHTGGKGCNIWLWRGHRHWVQSKSSLSPSLWTVTIFPPPTHHAPTDIQPFHTHNFLSLKPSSSSHKTESHTGLRVEFTFSGEFSWSLKNTSVPLYGHTLHPACNLPKPLSHCTVNTCLQIISFL